MKRILRSSIVLVAMLLVANLMYAQGIVKGTAKDDNGEPLIGATILLVGSSRGTATDFDGNYTLENVPAGEQQLRASYTGYNDFTQSVTVVDGQEVQLDFVLGLDAEVLEEVVVIGYGTVKKEDATGAVNSVSDEDFNRGAIVSPDNLIAGKIAGVQVLSNSGEPGGASSIRIRGGTSVNGSNEPLYVIDGVPIDNAGINPGGFQGGRNPLNFLSPEDIETFTVLKDASATAIYGSRGANGVILITTKRGKAGDRPRISYGTWVSRAETRNRLEVLNASQFRSLVTSARPENLSLLQDADTDWQDEVYQEAWGQSHNLTLTGGGESFGYRASVSYLNQDGIVRTSNVERTNFNLGYDHNLFDNSLTLRFNVKGSFTQDRISPNGAIGGAVAYNPTLPVREEGNGFGGFYEYPLSVLNAGTNPVSELEQTLDLNDGFRGLGNIEVNYNLPFVDGLSAKVNLGFDINTGERRRFLPTTLRSQQLNTLLPGEARAENYKRQSSLLESYLTYDKPLEGINSNLKLMAGYSYQDFNNAFPSYVANGLSNDFFGPLNPAGAEQVVVRNSVIENRLISFFGRANFDIANKYLFTATVRRDGSSRFGPDNRWGTFPSAAVGWKISEESFMDGVSALSNLKLRLGWGITGNQEIGDYQYLPRYSVGDALVQYQLGEDGFVTTVRPSAFDPGLQWEETETLNAGLDFEFMDGRFGGSLDVYRKITDNLLFTINIPAGTNLSNRLLTNIGSLENQGVELALNGYVVNTSKFQWNLSFNVAYNQNEITRTIDAGDDFLGIQYGGIGGGTGNTIQVLRVGESVNSFFVYEHILDESGTPRSDQIDYNEDGFTDLRDMYVDQNDDGVINESDRVVNENALPDFIYGLTSSMNLGNFDLNFTLRANTGNYIYNNTLASGSAKQNVTNQSAPPTNLLVRGLLTDFEEPQFLSDYYVEDASFIRLDNITLGYNFNLANRLKLRLYATGQNLLVLTEYTGLDPEIGNRATLGIPELGIDRDFFPRARTIIFGANLDF